MKRTEYQRRNEETMFSKKPKDRPDDQVIMRIVRDGKERNVTVREFVLSLNLSLEALTSVLVAKGIITPEDLLGELEKIQKTHAERQRRQSGGE